jgi:hypothetical protein
MAEVAPGRIAVLEDWWELVDGPRPDAREDEQVRIYTLDGTDGTDGTEERQFTPIGPEGRPFTARTLAVTGSGQHLLVGGALGGEQWQGGVARYDSATGSLDPTFGTDGIAATGSLDPRDLDARGDEPAQLDVTGPHAIPAGPDTPAAITRLWNPPATAG